MKDITELRAEIDAVDSQIIELFRQRMEISEGVAAYKQAVGKPIYDPERERQKLVKISKEAGEDLRTGAIMLFSTLFELSSAHQMKVMGKTTALTEQVTAAIDHSPKCFPQFPSVACQGVAGAYSQIACSKLFRMPDISYFPNFEDVFNATREQSGVLCFLLLLPPPL